MKVPDKISFSSDSNNDNRSSWTGEKFNMNVPERILVAGQHQHVGTKAPPPEIAFDNSLLTSESGPEEHPRVATPPRTLTLDRYPFPGVEEYKEQEMEFIPVAKPNGKVNMNDSNVQNSDLSMLIGEEKGLTPKEEVIHLRRQMANINMRVMALELENIGRVQREKFVVGFGIAYILLKVIIWMNRD
ncbi:hypothetical protein JTB14_023174 [Gonioctena quinquepunctata]|nr:hypothetical protein JTB14_023174 [Gonioctena quinquepunctata]